MRIKQKSFPIILAFILIGQVALAQPPCQNGPDGIIYIQGGATIQNYNPALPISATNPVANTIPNGGGGLAVANNLNGPGPSPTFYATSGGNWVYWDGATWVNTGHSAGGGGAVNPGGGGNFIYNLIGSSGQVWQYDGTGPSTLLLTVPGFSGGGPYDLVGDCDGGFYILRTNISGAGAFLRKYSSTGTLVQSWTATGSSGSAGGGFAIIGNTVYYHNGGGFHSGQITAGPNISFTPNTAAIPNPSDMACCPVCNVGKDTVYYCEDAPPVGLSTTLPATVTWTLHSGAANITGGGSNVNVTATSISVITATSNTSTGVDSFVVIPVPANVNAGADFTIAGCNPYTGTLNGMLSGIDTSLFTYSIAWTPAANIVSGGATETPNITQTALTRYFMTVTTPASEGGCLWVDSVDVDVEDFTPFANFDFDRILGCDFDTVVFTNTSVTNPNGTPSYQWTFDDGNFSSQENPIHIYGVQNNYNVTLQVTDNGCTDDTTIAVDVRHPLEADYLITNSGIAGDDSICLGQSFIFSPATVPLAGTGNLVFDWYFGDGTTLLGQVGTQQVYAYTAPGTYNVKMVITDTLGCQDSVIKTVFVDIPAYVELSATPTVICVGQQVYFTDSVAPNTFNVIYDFGDGNVLTNLHNPSHTYEAPGTYIVNLNAQYLVCPDADTSVSIQVNDYAQVNLGEDRQLCPGLDTAVVLQDIDNPAQILNWSTGAQSPSITVGINETGRYWATADNAGCSSTDSIWVKRHCYLNIPNSFSPNGDGRNDYFIPRQLLSSGLQEFSMKIFNRWGELIFQGTNIDGRGWDGKYDGKEQPVGVYVYMIDAQWQNGYRNSFKGNVTLLR